MRIQEIVRQALATGYLTVAAENQLRSLLRSPCDSDDLTAFWHLQRAAMAGSVVQESRQFAQSH